MTASPANRTVGARQSLGSVASRPALTAVRRRYRGDARTKGTTTMNRVVAGAIALAAGAAVLVGCSNDKGAATATAGDTQVGRSGDTQVNVDGNDLAGLDVNSVTCVKQGGKINVASGAINGQAGLAVVMTDANPPTVDSLGMTVDGNALAVTNTMGAKVGSADVKVDGSTYTISGEASGADIKNPMAGMVTK